MSLQILIADDDLEDLELLEEAILEMEPDSSIDKVTSGREAIEHLGSYEDSLIPDIIILDYNMPEVNGFTVLTFIGTQERYDQIPRVILSTSDAQLHINECISKGATQYFVKPTTKKQLDRVTQQILSLIPKN